MYGRRAYRKRYAKRRVYKRRNLSKLISRKVNYALAKNAETKYLDAQVYSSGILNQWSIYSISDTVRGTGDKGERIGEMIKPVDLLWKLDFQPLDTFNRLRMVIFIWNEDSSFIVPTDTQLFENVVDLQAFYNNDAYDAKKFRILYDREFDANTTGDTNAVIVTRRHKFKYHKINYNQLASSPSIQGTGKIYVAFRSDSNLTPHAQIAFDSRLRYKDI